MVLVPPFHPPIPFSTWKFDHVSTATIHGQADQALPHQPGNPRPRGGLSLCLFRKAIKGRLALLGEKGTLIRFHIRLERMASPFPFSIIGLCALALL